MEELIPNGSLQLLEDNQKGSEILSIQPSLKRKYNCDECEYVTPRPYDLKRHKEIKHVGIRYPCNKCEFNASTRGNLKVHIESMHDCIRHPCDKCDYIAAKSTNLKAHKKRKHVQKAFIDAVLKLKQSDTRTDIEDVEEQKTSVQLDESSLEYMTKEEPSDYLKSGVEEISSLLFVQSSLECVIKEEPSDYLETEGFEIAPIQQSPLKRKYKCDECEYLTPRPYDLRKHKEIKHIGIRYPCNKCEFYASTRGNLKVHIESMHDCIRYTCDQCDYIAAKSQTLKDHKKRKHTKKDYIEDILKIKQCENNMDLRGVEEQNGLQLSESSSECIIKEEASDHLKTREEEQNGLQLTKSSLECIVKKETSEYLITDVATKLGDPLELQTKKKRKYNCDMCDYISTRTNDLKRHKEIKHIGIRYQCDKCELSASTPANLKVHIESKHENVIYPCDQCDYIATLPGSLKVHIGRKHYIKGYGSTDFLENEQMHVKFDPEGAEEEEYVEDFDPSSSLECIVKEEAQEDLAELEGIPTMGEQKAPIKRKYNCDECEYSTVRSNDLKRHKEIKHVGIRYPCEKCDFTSSTPGNLKVHNKTRHKEGNL